MSDLDRRAAEMAGPGSCFLEAEAHQLPSPMTPVGWDLTPFPYFPFYISEFLGSNLNLEATDAEFRAAVRLMLAAWHQVPATSLPSSDAALAHLAGFGKDIQGWSQVQQMALTGFVLCADGRYYNRRLAEHAKHAIAVKDRASKQRDVNRARLARWREGRRERGDQTKPETLDETRFATRVETRMSGVRKEGKGKEGKGKSLSRVIELDRDFEEFWGRYPRKVGRDAARRAYEKARRCASQADLLTAIEQQIWSPETRFRPHPTTWLSQGRWKDAPEEHRRESGRSEPVSSSRWMLDILGGAA